MKNAFLIPTDKPSDLVIRDTDGKLSQHCDVVTWNGKNQHIYVTDDSGTVNINDWCFDRKEGGEVFKIKEVMQQFRSVINSLSDKDVEEYVIIDTNNKKRSGNFSLMKVIWTTDQELIGDGVKPIDRLIVKERIENFKGDKDIILKSFIIPIPTGNLKLIKPPLGLIPKGLYYEQIRTNRIQEVKSAIDRYLKAGLSINEEWIREYNELLDTKDISVVATQTETQEFIDWIDSEQIPREDGLWIKYFNEKDNYLTTKELFEYFKTDRLIRRFNETLNQPQVISNEPTLNNGRIHT